MVDGGGACGAEWGGGLSLGCVCCEERDVRERMTLKTFLVARLLLRFISFSNPKPRSTINKPHTTHKYEHRLNAYPTLGLVCVMLRKCVGRAASCQTARASHRPTQLKRPHSSLTPDHCPLNSPHNHFPLPTFPPETEHTPQSDVYPCRKR